MEIICPWIFLLNENVFIIVSGKCLLFDLLHFCRLYIKIFRRQFSQTVHGHFSCSEIRRQPRNQTVVGSVVMKQGILCRVKELEPGDNYKYILIQKKNPRANYFHIEDDLLLKGEPVSVYAFTNGMYIQNWAAINLKTKLEKVLERDDLSEEIRARVTETLSGLSEDDNNVIVWGKMKK